MKGKALTFHVPPDASPASVEALLTVLAANGKAPIGREHLRESMRPVLGGEPRGETLALAEDLGVIGSAGSGFVATPRAVALQRCNSVPDLVHGLQYRAWSANAAGRLGRF